VAVALLLLAPSLPVSAGSPARVELAASPVAMTPSPTATHAGNSVKLPPAPAIDEGSSGPNVRTRTDRQGSDQIPKAPEPTATEDTSIPRLDDPVLRWLPEIMAASAQWGVPPELIAAVMRVESTGEPGVISPSGARGLMQMMPDQIGGQGVPQSLWHDPATNIAAGAQGLYTRMVAQGNWQGAVGAYLGFGCDVWGTCTDAYVRAVFGWAAYYQPIIADPRHSGFRVLPKDWAYGPIALYQLPAPPKLEEPPKPKKPTTTPTATSTPKPGETPATPEPGNPTAVPTEPGQPEPTAQPTEAPPTEAPTAVPTQPAPTVVPTEPPPPPTEGPPPPPAESPSA
jgi:soluble lytic murein transglycosylase-like protein